MMVMMIIMVMIMNRQKMTICTVYGEVMSVVASTLTN